MGYAKSLMAEYDARGYGSSDKHVCHGCIGDYALKEYITINGYRQKCDYCHKVRKCVELEDLMSRIINGIKFEYEDATGCMGYDSKEGGFYGARTWDNWDLVHDQLELGIEEDSLLDDIVNTMDDSVTWCEIDPYHWRESKEHLSLWRSFCNQVKKETRYVFFRAKTGDGKYEPEPFEILDIIGANLEQLGLIRNISKGTTFFRGRMHQLSESYNTDKDLGAPPYYAATSNRMSPEGISIFYGASDANTVLHEIYDKQKDMATVAEFYNLRELKCIDLTVLEQIPFPSLFDEKRRNNRESLSFILDFNEDITKEIDTFKGIEYVPAQVVAEYFRHVFRLQDDSKIDGIVYKSSVVEWGICYALFFDNEQCIYTKKRSSRKRDCVLRLRKKSVNRYAPKVDWEIEPNKSIKDLTIGTIRFI